MANIGWPGPPEDMWDDSEEIAQRSRKNRVRMVRLRVVFVAQLLTGSIVSAETLR